MNQSQTLNEIDHLEGIAQAYKRGRPIVPMTGVLEDISDARIICDEISEYDRLIKNTEQDIAHATEDLNALHKDVLLYTDEQAESQEYLDKLMAALSARLER